MDRITGVMMSLLTGQVCGGEPPLPALTADEAAHLYALSKTYDLAHLAGSALLHRGLLPDGPLRAAFEKQVLLAVYRCETQGSDLAQLDALLTHGQIPFLPLKGSVLRQYYPSRGCVPAATSTCWYTPLIWTAPWPFSARMASPSVRKAPTMWPSLPPPAPT